MNIVINKLGRHVTMGVLLDFKVLVTRLGIRSGGINISGIFLLWV